MLWIWLVLLYGILKGVREICKKKALQRSSSAEVLFLYSLISFLFLLPDIPNVGGLAPIQYLYIFLKSFIIFIAWICSFKAIKKLPISLYGVLDLSRVLFATILGVTVLGEAMDTLHIIGLILVCAGLLLLKCKWPPFSSERKSTRSTSTNTDSIASQDSNATTIEASASDSTSSSIKSRGKFLKSREALYVIAALVSCMLNALSGLMDKLLMKDMNSSQLQFWYMLFLVILYLIYMFISKADVSIVRGIKNPWIWLLSILFVIADRALFIANGMEGSSITVMTLIKQSGCIVTILAGRYIFKEKNTLHKLICAGIIIIGIVCGVI